MGQSSSSLTLQQLADHESSRPIPASLLELESDMYTDAPATFEFHAPEVPFDDEGFVRAFYPPPPLDGLPDADAHRPARYDSTADIQAFFDEFGFVVIRDVVPRELLDGIERELWSKPGLEGLDSSDANSWIKADWSQVFGGSYNERHGFLGFAIGESQAAHAVRQLPAMHRAFATVFRIPDLWFKYDRFGLMRPTRDIKITRRTERELQWMQDMADARELLFDEAPIGAAASATSLLHREQLSHEPGDDEIVTVQRPEWQTRSDFIHFDLNPWLEEKFCRVQGVVAVSEHTATSGGFHCIPGFHKRIRDWAAVHQGRRSPKTLVDLSTPELERYLIRVTMRPGSIVIWDSRLPHGNWPNDSDRFRMVFYLTYFPALSDNPEHVSARQALVSCMNDVEHSDLGRWVSGLERYPAHLTTNAEQRAHLNMASRHNLGQWGVS